MIKHGILVPDQFTVLTRPLASDFLRNSCSSRLLRACNDPPVILVVALSHHLASRSYDILFQLPLSVKMIISLIRPLADRLLLVFLPFFHHPRYKHILLMSYIPTAPAAFLLQRPHKHQRLTRRRCRRTGRQAKGPQDGRDGFDPPGSR